jgi:hypothetical protein
VESVEFTKEHLYQLIEVCVRTRISRREATAGEDETKDVLDVSNQLLEALEALVGSSTFIGVYGEVQRNIESSKAEKKRRLAAEAITDPKSYAQRKVCLLLVTS